ncbi:ribonuclease H-like domain-containing protein [Tanacetum coccineum]
MSNLKKYLSDKSLVIPLEELNVDDKLHFVEEPVEVMDREIKQLKRSRIPIIKVNKVKVMGTLDGLLLNQPGQPSLPGQTSILGQLPGQGTILPNAFHAMPLQDPVLGNWNLYTGASSLLNDSVISLSDVPNMCIYPSVSVGNGYTIPVTNSGHSVLPTPHRPLHLTNVVITPNIVKKLIYVRQFVRDNNCIVEFDAFGFSIKDFMTHRVLLRCDRTGDLYLVTKPSTIPHDFLTNQYTWHQRLRHPGSEVLQRILSGNSISCTKEKPLILCHACQIGKHVRLPFVSSNMTNRPTQCLNLHVSSMAFNDPNSQNAMFDEYNALIKNNTWTLVPRPTDINIVRCMWLFHHKYLVDDILSCYKARLVVNGSTHIEGIDVDETFSPVVKLGTIRTVLSLATSRHWPVHQLDVKNAFLHSDLAEIVYMHQPLGFQNSAHLNYVCLLQRSLYGLKQPPRDWFSHFSAYITLVGFIHSRCDSSLFIYRQGTDTAYLLMYVDDIVLTTSAEILLQQIIASLHHEFSMTDLGSLNYFLGIRYVIRNPVDTESKLGNDGDPVSDPKLYKSLAGSLQYLTFTRPNISYDVQQVCLYMHDPREPYFSALKRILRYVRGTLDYRLQLCSSSTTSLVAYSDADWAGFPTNRRSTFDNCIFLDNNILSWSLEVDMKEGNMRQVDVKEGVMDGEDAKEAECKTQVISPNHFLQLVT